MTFNAIPMDELRKLIRVDADGRLFAVAQRRNLRVGQEIRPVPEKTGYVCIEIHKRKFRAHRIVFALTHGRWPVGQVDHINGDKADNRPSNLREATPEQNMANMKSSGRNTSGVRGVWWSKEKKRWIAQIQVRGTVHRLGRFKNLDDAARAHRAAEVRLKGEFAPSEPDAEDLATRENAPTFDLKASVHA